jgi:hypothetical protein
MEENIMAGIANRCLTKKEFVERFVKTIPVNGEFNVRNVIQGSRFYSPNSIGKMLYMRDDVERIRTGLWRRVR